MRGNLCKMTKPKIKDWNRDSFGKFCLRCRRVLCILLQTRIIPLNLWGIKDRHVKGLCEIKFSGVGESWCDANPLWEWQGAGEGQKYWINNSTSAPSSLAICTSLEPSLRSNAPGLALHDAPAGERIPEYQCCFHTFLSVMGFDSKVRLKYIVHFTWLPVYQLNYSMSLENSFIIDVLYSIFAFLTFDFIQNCEKGGALFGHFRCLLSQVSTYLTVVFCLFYPKKVHKSVREGPVYRISSKIWG